MRDAVGVGAAVGLAASVDRRERVGVGWLDVVDVVDGSPVGVVVVVVVVATGSVGLVVSTDSGATSSSVGMGVGSEASSAGALA
ncbi:hypothetical protein [Arsenicicoccus dermatophilus]|uniref:hypothetical protein n=1 Tax=Arsenicicoccus dermatophilus TaxID=1076331 RepID=UPI003916D2EC